MTTQAPLTRTGRGRAAALTVLILSRTGHRGAPAALLGCGLPLSALAAVIGLLTR